MKISGTYSESGVKFNILDPKTSIDIKIESNEAFICTLDECNDKVVGGSGFKNVLNIFAMLLLLFVF